MSVDRPHHDPSALYVSEPHPRLGDRVTLRMRAPASWPLADVVVRYRRDGEGVFEEARRETSPDPHPGPHPGPRPETGQWWTVDVTVSNPTLQYRWYLVGADGTQAWLNGTGVHARDVTDAADFRLTTTPAPDWVADAVVYQIFPDRFARSTNADARPVPAWAIASPWNDPLRTYEERQHAQIFGGDLDGVIEHLDHIVALGANVIYLTPFFPAESNHRYDATTFDHVDDLLGGDNALRRLLEAAHARGVRVLGDFTPNHTGAGHEWFRTARAHPTSPEHDFYTWVDEPPGYACWLGFPSLPKLNHASPALAERLTGEAGALRRWLRFGLDGWRIDVANMTGRLGAVDLNRQVAERIRAAVDAEGDRWLVAEHFYDLHHDVDGSTWHGAMNYAAFSRLLWAWLERPTSDEEDAHFAVTARRPPLDGPGLVATMTDFMAQVPWAVTTASLNIVGSHDTGRIRWRVGDPGRVVAALGLAFTMPGVPMVYYGDEIGLLGRTGEYGRRPFPWDAPDTWDAPTLAAVRALGALRRSTPALRHGGLRWLGATPDAIAFARESPEGGALVLASRAASGPLNVPAASLPGAESGRLAFGDGITLANGNLRLDAPASGLAVWVWET